MAVLFVSHSSKDDTAAKGLETWLRAKGFTDLFIDHSHIAGGEKWAQALRDGAGACRVVICFVTEHWLASDECFGEFKAAWYMGKRIIPLVAAGAGYVLPGNRLANVLAEDQGFDVTHCIDQGRLDLRRDPDIERGLETGLRSAGALSRVGLDPEAFAIDPHLRRTPFPGLASFGDDDADAALFYGRSREIAEALEELRKVRAEGDRRAFVILGASGAGKSSLLKAGIVPRLRREAPAWLPLRVFRPGADPLLNFAEALAKTLADFGKVEAPGRIRDRLFDAWAEAKRRSDGAGLTASGGAEIEAALETEGSKLRAASHRAGATILISIDQAEEMARAEGESGDALTDYLRASLTTAASHWQLAFTIRTDSFHELQNHQRFQNLEARGYDLRVIPGHRFESLVEEPAKRYGVDVEKALVDAVIADAPTEDALPLLAFALQRLWRQYAASGSLTKDNYHRLGGLKGLIEDAAERALRDISPEEDVPLPPGPPRKPRVELAAATFVPALAQINNQGATIRRVASWNSFTAEQQDFLLRFEQWRLLVRKTSTADGGGTVEVAHEALFREWTRLEIWLEPERARLEALHSLQIDALTWDRNGRDAGFVNHRSKRLAEAQALAAIDAYRKRLHDREFDYLAACRKTERQARRQTRRVRALVTVLMFGIAAGVIGWLEQEYFVELWRWHTVINPYLLTQVRPYVLTAEAERALKAQDTFKECGAICPEMVVLAPGEFIMGSPDNETHCYPNEGPRHKVVIAEPFAVSRYDVTFAEWDVCVANGDCNPKVSDSSFGHGLQPVINVTWDDAQHFVAWLARMTGRPYRLLTEAQWEYAARAGTTTAYPFGDDPASLLAHAWYKANSDSKPHPVGKKAANQWNLYDMEGDVWQWVEDCYHVTYDGAPTDGSAWTAGECNSRVLRGGSWISEPQFLRSACREYRSPDIRSDNRGFRVGRMLVR
jgi:formylglycine-generating enzyme required for sulfatase activity